MKASIALSAVALLLAAPSFAAPAGVTGRPPTLCNPINLPYCFQPGTPSWRTAADPAVVVYKGEYWLFATKSRGYWHSKDFTHWNLVTQTNLPLDNDAPGAFAIGNKLYWTAINSGIYET